MRSECREMPGEGNRILFSASSSSSSARHVGNGCGSDPCPRIRVSLDLVTAARWHLSLLRSLPASPPPLPRSIRRYEELWMPLISNLSRDSLSAPVLLPPSDVHWVWHCHCLNPASYREYCASRFGFLIDRPAVFDEENEEYALSQCREIWAVRYPREPFDLEEVDGDGGAAATDGGELIAAVEKYRSLCTHFADPFTCETVYLVSARRRFLRFLRLASGLADGAGRVMPASDVLLMWLTHQSFPGCYARDMEELGVDLGKGVVGFGETAVEGELERTRRAWEEAFDEPYERAGAPLEPPHAPARAAFTWDSAYLDVNRRYRGLLPRSLLEVCVFLKGKWQEKETRETFVRLRTDRCHRELKLDNPVSKLSSEMWQKAWHLFCEFGTRGIVIEVWRPGNSCLRRSKLLKKLVFMWNDLLCATSLTLTNQLELQVCVFLKGKWQEKETRETFVRLRTVRCHRELKLDNPVRKLSSEMWQKAWHLFCEFGTRGIVIEVRRPGNSCLGRSKLLNKLVFLWNDLLRVTSLTLTNQLELQVRALSSITPPVQAPYFLKCVPDRVTDDSGAMISDEILRRNRYRPQGGRWISRTVLDHAGRECFVIRIRVGKGFWRWGAETPTAVKWEDRIIEVREGPWKYIASSVGYAPEKVVGTATPKKGDSEEKKAIWSLSTGDMLMIQWEDGLDIQLENDTSTESARLLRGRKLQYEVRNAYPGDRIGEEEEEYLTLVRFSSENPNGRATALINWKLFAMEFLPEEDAVLVLLLCMAIVRTISAFLREDVGDLLVRRRVTEVKIGHRDWGSVMLPSSSSNLSPHLQPWYWNAKEVLAPAQVKGGTHLINKYSAADGKEALYKQAIIS